MQAALLAARAHVPVQVGALIHATDTGRGGKRAQKVCRLSTEQAEDERQHDSRISHTCGSAHRITLTSCYVEHVLSTSVQVYKRSGWVNVRGHMFGQLRNCTAARIFVGT